MLRAPSKTWTIFGCLLATTLASACSAIFVGDCVDIGVAGLAISAVDARTQQSVLEGATVIVIHDGVRDSVTLHDQNPRPEYYTSFTQSGSFIIIIRIGGFREWTSNEVVVGRDRCGHPKTQHITAVLTT